MNSEKRFPTNTLNICKRDILNYALQFYMKRYVDHDQEREKNKAKINDDDGGDIISRKIEFAMLESVHKYWPIYLKIFLLICIYF